MWHKVQEITLNNKLSTRIACKSPYKHSNDKDTETEQNMEIGRALNMNKNIKS